MKNSKLEAMQFLIKSIKSFLTLILFADFWIIRKNEKKTFFDNKFTNLSEKYRKCSSYLRIRLK